jgi:hypothetical protein
MFCPKCGKENEETGRFCRSCGTDLGTVSAALSGNLSQDQTAGFFSQKRHDKSKEPQDILTEGIRDAIVGIGFFIASLALFFTGIWGGHSWWWALLFPAFGCFASGISNIVKYQMMTKNPASLENSPNQPSLINQTSANTALPPTQTEFVAPDLRYKTGDLVPPSVVENTTHHLKIDKEAETITLPKK